MLDNFTITVSTDTDTNFDVNVGDPTSYIIINDESNRVAAENAAASAQVAANSAQTLSDSVQSLLNSNVYPNRAQFVTDNANGVFDTLPNDYVMGVSYKETVLYFYKSTGSTGITDIPNWLPKVGPDMAISPQHYMDNTTPLVTDMTEAFKSALRFSANFSGSTITSNEVINAGISPAIDCLGENMLISSPIIIGRVNGLGAGWFYGLSLRNGYISCDPNGTWTSIAAGMPGYAFVIADRLNADVGSEAQDLRIRSITFEKSFFIDCNYATGGRFWENTAHSRVEGNVYHIGFKCFGDLTSFGDKNRVGSTYPYKTKNVFLQFLNNVYHSSSTYRNLEKPFLGNGIVLKHTPTTGTNIPLALTGSEVVSGEWVSPVAPTKICTRLSFPKVDAGVSVTITGFADYAKNNPISETVTLRRNSTEYQDTPSTLEFAVVTGITLSDTISGQITIGGSMQNFGVGIYTADAMIDGVNISSGQDIGLIVGSFGSVQCNNMHSWSRQIVIEKDCAYSSSFTNCFFDFTDVRFYSFHHIVSNALMTAGDTRIVAIATEPDTDFSGLIVGPFVGSPDRPSNTEFLEFETEGAGTIVDSHLRGIQYLPDVHSKGGTSNTTGYWTKYNDGRMKLVATFSLGASNALGDGTVTDPYKTTPLDFTFPLPFVSFPLSVAMTPYVSNNADDTRAVTVSASGVTITDLLNITAFRYSNETSASIVTVSITIEGRWF